MLFVILTAERQYNECDTESVNPVAMGLFNHCYLIFMQHHYIGFGGVAAFCKGYQIYLKASAVLCGCPYSNWRLHPVFLCGKKNTAGLGGFSGVAVQFKKSWLITS
jgi:hypothetical protein